MRTLARSPGFTSAAVLTLTLGIGANTALFSIVDGVLLRPLPYANADRLVRLNQTNLSQTLDTSPLSVPDFEDFRRQARSFSAMGAFESAPMNISGPGDAVELQTAFVLGNFFGTLGVPAQIGRPLLEDDIRQAAPNAVISDRLWRTYYGADQSTVGRKPIVFGGRSYTVVGVMPPSFRYPTPDTDVWTPRSVLSVLEIGPNVRNQRTLQVVARIAPGLTLEALRSELTAIADRLAASYPPTNSGWGATAVPLENTIVGDIGRALAVLVAVVGGILLICCVNLANMQLARGPARVREIAIRTALGATRMRIVQQLLTETVALALLGGILGLMLAIWAVPAVLALSADTLPRIEDIRVDGRVVGFAFGVAVVTGVIFGLVPALRVAHADPHIHLHGGRGSVGHGQRLHGALVVAEIAIAVVLVIGAALLARSLRELRTVNPGFDPDRGLAVTMQVNVTGVARPIGHIVQRREEWIQRQSAIPGVVSVGSVTSLPLQKRCGDSIELVRADGVRGPGGAGFRADNCLVSSGYLRTMGIPLLRGTTLPDKVKPGAPTPFLVSETAARRFWPGEDPIDKMVQIVGGGGQAVVTGIVGDVKQLGLREQPPPAVYFPQETGPRLVTTLVVRTIGDPVLLFEPIRRAIRELDAGQAVRSITTLDSVLSESIARDRFFTLLVGGFGGLALLLAAIGVYGVLAYSVAQRTKEIGVRMALGAKKQTVIRMVLGYGVRLVTVALAVGLLGSFAVTRFVSSLLYRTDPHDLTTFAAVPAVIALVALTACVIPAWRAARVEPVTALRAE